MALLFTIQTYAGQNIERSFEGNYLTYKNVDDALTDKKYNSFRKNIISFSKSSYMTTNVLSHCEEVSEIPNMNQEIKMTLAAISNGTYDENKVIGILNCEDSDGDGGYFIFQNMDYTSSKLTRLIFIGAGSDHTILKKM